MLIDELNSTTVRYMVPAGLYYDRVEPVVVVVDAVMDYGSIMMDYFVSSVHKDREVAVTLLLCFQVLNFRGGFCANFSIVPPNHQRTCTLLYVLYRYRYTH